MNPNLENLGKDAAKLANEKIIEPAMALAHDAQEAITVKYDRTRDAIANNMSHAQDSMVLCRDRTSVWISANPLTAVGLAMLAGMALTSIGRSRHG